MMGKYASVAVFLAIYGGLTVFSLFFSPVASTAVPSGDDLVIAMNGNNISTIGLLQRLNISGSFRFGALCPKDKHSCKTRCPHGVVNDTGERQKELPCYCDNHCLKAGDCCYDFFSSCRHVQQVDQNRQWECINMNSSSNYGVIMKTKCPKDNVDPLCETIDSLDLLRNLPVVDGQQNVVYRNVFCARCNYVHSVSYWSMAADCGRIPASALPKDKALLMAFIRENCTINYTPTDRQQPHMTICLAAANTCSLKKRVEKEPVLEELCSFYAFPVCGNSYKNPHCALCNGDDITQYDCGCVILKPTTDTKISTTKMTSTNERKPTTPRHKTTATTISQSRPPTTLRHPTTPRSTPGYPLPHGTTPGIPGTTPGMTPGYPPTPGIGLTPPTTPFFPSTVPGTTARQPTTPGYPNTPKATTTGVTVPPPPPPLNILFDFSSDSNEINIQGKTTVVKYQACKEGFVYDPFVETCREVFHSKLIVNTNRTVTNSTNSTIDFTMLNCSFIRLNSLNTIQYPNGTMWVPLYQAIYNKTEYVVNGSYVYICSNFHSNYSMRETVWSYVVSPLQILTYAGSSVSIISLLILIVVYGIFKELRTLPGKNLINLSFAMIFYQIFLFVAGLRNNQGLCILIAILLHYFLLSSFAWMSVMAFDVTKTFAFRKEVRSTQRKKTHGKTLIKYCVCAWGLPAVVAVTCLGLDHTGNVEIGYGKGGFCWIKNGTALLIVVGIPVALVILFNFIALTWTVAAIYKVRKVTNKLADQGSQSSLALLYIKLTCVLGLTWVLGYLNSIVNNDATTYLFVSVNSLQGFFICLTFVANTRTVALLKGKAKKHSRTRNSNETIDTKL